MRRRIVAVVAAALAFGAPAVPAHAAMSDCPQSVQDYRGTNPSFSEVKDWLSHAAEVAGVRYAVLWAIAYQESGWRQYNADGTVRVSSDAVCGIGIMQITADGYTDANKLKLATDYRYNIDEGAKLLRAKWDLSQQTPPPSGASADDPLVVENWYYAICLYNGCGTDTTYPDRVVETMRDPFRRIPELSIRSLLRPQPFTRPQEADPSYVFPAAFQARYGASAAQQVFVFYDHTTGTVTSTVQKATHVNAVDVTYPYPQRGPDDDYVVCAQCGGWRLAEGAGVAGRAHWTNTVTGPSQSTATYPFALPRAGLYRVWAYVPSLGDVTLGTATYTVGGTTVTLDQNAKKDAWRDLGTHMLGASTSVVLGDTAAVANTPVVADAIRVEAVTALTISAPRRVVPWATATGVGGRLTHVGASPAGIADDYVRIWRRRPGETAWRGVENAGTDADGNWHSNLVAYENYEYMAVYGPFPDRTTAYSGVVRVDSSVRVTGTLSRTTAPAGASVTFTARVLPLHVGRYVYLQRYYDGGWHNSLWKPMGDSGYATFTFAKSAGTYWYRAYRPADADHAAGWSAPVKLTVT